MTICVIDLGIGNLHSITKALRHVAGSREVEVRPASDDPIGADIVVLPGVGAFAAAVPALRRITPALRHALDRGVGLFGICLGMQLLYERSAEGAGAGLGVLAGEVRSLTALPLPHMGFAEVTARCAAPTLAIPSIAYYAHSFRCVPRDPESIVATTRYGDEAIPAVVRSGRIVGCQFHPEKSSRPGLAFLDSLLSEVTS